MSVVDEEVNNAEQGKKSPDKPKRSASLLETLPLPIIKWIFPTAPSHPMALLEFDVGKLSEEGPNEWEGLDASAAHIANLVSTELADVKVGIGGFSMGAAIALYSVTCYGMGRHGNDQPYPVNLRAVIGLSGWLTGSRNESLIYFWASLVFVLCFLLSIWVLNYLVRTLPMMVRKACSLLVHLLKTNWSSQLYLRM
ncbi:hypothetical protein UlMin_012365 [Ulmus minor]